MYMYKGFYFRVSILLTYLRDIESKTYIKKILLFKTIMLNSRLKEKIEEKFNDLISYSKKELKAEELIYLKNELNYLTYVITGCLIDSTTLDRLYSAGISDWVGYKGVIKSMQKDFQH